MEITLHNAVVPFDGDEIVIDDPKSIETFTIDHTLMNGDCTRVILTDGTTYQVQEDEDTIRSLIGDP